ncbi:MobA/MobL family protein [Alkalibacillus aidingensis]|uniref:MobA/MobL family protein n=1 Tax=Alkalibacillus aidingensis TaxID=2747607 RepID=UPI0016603B52|nr:MobA/MobL family protein [Alkalibacillus aidingensis]
MSMFYCQMNRIGLKNNRMATNAIAYRSGEKIKDNTLDKTFDYSKKDDVHYKEILLPEKHPEWSKDRERLWNEVQNADKKKDGTYYGQNGKGAKAEFAKELQLALPSEVDQETNKQMVKEFAEKNFVQNGLPVDMALHKMDYDSKKNESYMIDGQKDLIHDNPHAHLMIPNRQLNEDGFNSKKYRENGWKDRNLVNQIREKWAEHHNEFLKENGYEHVPKISEKSYKEQGIDKIPTRKIGAQNTQKAEEAREYNQEVKELENEREDLKQSVKEREVDSSQQKKEELKEQYLNKKSKQKESPYQKQFQETQRKELENRQRKALTPTQRQYKRESFNGYHIDEQTDKIVADKKANLRQLKTQKLTNRNQKLPPQHIETSKKDDSQTVKLNNVFDADKILDDAQAISALRRYQSSLPEEKQKEEEKLIKERIQQRTEKLKQKQREKNQDIDVEKAKDQVREGFDKTKSKLQDIKKTFENKKHERPPSPVYQQNLSNQRQYVAAKKMDFQINKLEEQINQIETRQQQVETMRDKRLIKQNINYFGMTKEEMLREEEKAKAKEMELERGKDDYFK